MSDGTRTDQAIDSCYTFLDLLWPESMEPSLAHGMFNGRYADLTFEEAHQAQRRYVMDELGIGPGTRVADIGCGYGLMLEEVRRRGGLGAGITLSGRQTVHCRKRGLDVDLMNWRDLPPSWNGRFDCVIANGCFEHFVSAEEMAAGQQESIYRSFFRRCGELLDPTTGNKRLFLSSIYQRRLFEPRAAFGDYRNHDEYMVFLLNKTFGAGWYPTSSGQITECARESFEPLRLEEGGRDYLETYYRVARNIYFRWTPSKAWKLITRGLPTLLRDKDLLYRLKYCYHGTWGWQFEGKDPPMGLISITFQGKAVAAP